MYVHSTVTPEEGNDAPLTRTERGAAGRQPAADHGACAGPVRAARLRPDDDPHDCGVGADLAGAALPLFREQGSAVAGAVRAEYGGCSCGVCGGGCRASGRPCRATDTHEFRCTARECAVLAAFLWRAYAAGGVASAG